ncbi:MAG: hypothetical protein K0Q87_406 [Neobacillus sp.]|nr:hypothetical protein [Neobacillus sp.]
MACPRANETQRRYYIMDEDTFGILPQRDTDPLVDDSWWDYMEIPDPYGDSHCPNCGYPLE